MASFIDTARVLVRDGTDMTLRQIVLVGDCVANGATTVRAAAEGMRIAKPAVTRAADRAAELGLLERKPDPNDRRSVLLKATAKGRRFIEALGA